jgi:hypothetical protein
VFRIARTLLARVENDVTGDILLDEFIVPIPPARIDQARAAAAVLGTQIAGKLPFVPGAWALTDSPLNSCSTTPGARRLPSRVRRAFRPWKTQATFCCRASSSNCHSACRHRPTPRLPQQPSRIAWRPTRPMACAMRFEVGSSQPGWDAPPVASWLEASMRDASRATFGQDAMYLGTGGASVHRHAGRALPPERNSS